MLLVSMPPRLAVLLAFINTFPHKPRPMARRAIPALHRAISKPFQVQLDRPQLIRERASDPIKHFNEQQDDHDTAGI